MFRDQPSETGRRELGYSAPMVLGVALMLLAVPFSMIFDEKISWERQPLEELQALVLLVSGLYAGFLGVQSEDRQRYFWWGAMLIWFIMCAREQSWGAVYIDPVSWTEHGPFYSSSALSYKPLVAPVVATILLIAIGLFSMGGGFGIVSRLTRGNDFPWLAFAGFAAGMLLSAASEDKMGMTVSFIPGSAQIMEETGELAAYVFLVAMQAKVLSALRRGL